MPLWCSVMSVVLVFNVTVRKIVIIGNGCSLPEFHTVHLTASAREFVALQCGFWLRFVSDQSLTLPIIFLVKNNLTS